jgi:hypothetical protein
MAKAARRSLSKAASQSQEPQAEPGSGLISATIDAATGKIVEVLSLDGAGASEKLTTGRRATLSKQTGDATLEDLFGEAFEAGIACVLGDDDLDAEEAEAGDTDEDVALRRQILRQMIERSTAQRLMQKDVLGRAIVRTLIQKAAAKSHPRTRAGATRARAAQH